MKKAKILVIVLALVLVLSVGVLAGCNAATNEPEAEQKTQYTVTFFDGDSVLKSVKVDSGAKVESWTPEVEGKTFVDWFATPVMSHKFDFDQAITEDKAVFAGLVDSNQADDARAWAIVGSGKGDILTTSDWGKTINAEHALAKGEGNTFTYTIDLYEGDQFQFAINTAWENKRGFGYLATDELDGAKCFTAMGGIGETASKGQNITVGVSGNYTFTLTTYPSDDYYDVDNVQYSEAQKEVYNLSNFDKISWVRNGDAAEMAATRLDYMIKGANITAWGNMCNPATQMTNEDGVYSLNIYLKENDQVMFVSQNYNLETFEVTPSASVLAFSNLDDASKALFTQMGNNMGIQTSGNYKFVYNSESKVLTAELLNETAPVENDYYLDGVFDGNEWNDSLFAPEYKFVKNGDVYELNGIEFAVGDVFMIQGAKLGATAETDGWRTDSYNARYLKVASELVVSDNPAPPYPNHNFRVLTAGTYNITFDPYSKIVGVEVVGGENLVHAKGTFNDWSVNDDSKFTKITEDIYEYEITLTEGSDFGLMLGGSAGTFVNASALGDAEGNVNDLFGTTGNFVCSQAGTYKIVYNFATAEVNIFAV